MAPSHNNDQRSLLGDPLSQIFCLKDALASGSGELLLNAFESVAVTRGVEQLAVDARVTSGAVRAALHSAGLADYALLQQLVAGIIGNLQPLIDLAVDDTDTGS